jgi:hypothetical protein
MNYIQINFNEIELGTIATQLESDEIETLYKEFINDENYDESIDDFVEWLDKTGNDNTAYRFLIDDIINIFN